MNKARKRLRQAIGAVAAQFSMPLAGMLLSLAVVRLYSRDFWGAYVQHLLVVSLVLAAISMGSRDYLLRQYSRAPQRIGQQLADSVSGKLVAMAGLLFILLWLPMGPLHKTVILLWLPAQLSWQAFEALVQYRRLFRKAAAIELAATALLVAALLALKPGLYAFLMLVVGSQFLKGLLYFLLNREYMRFQMLSRAKGKAFLQATLPFLLLTLAGAASSRGELYVMGLMEGAASLGQYQVLSNFIHSSHLLASALLLPFIKNLYRLGPGSLRNLEKNFLLAGLGLAPLLAAFIFLVVHYGYGFRLAFIDYLLSGGIILAFFAYVVRIQACFKHGRERYVTGMVVLMGMINVALSIWLVPAFGISGALLSALAAQGVGVAGFFLGGFRTGRQ